MKSLQIDIVSDVVCPWCAVGYGNLSQALTELSNEVSAEIHWHPFQLNPNLGAEGQDIGEHLNEKYGLTPQQRTQNQQHLQQAGERAGVIFNFNDRSRIYNTLDCHVLLDFAATKDKQTQLKLALFDSYFTQGKNVSDQTELLSICESVGLDIEEAKSALDNDQLREKVLQEEDHFKTMGIQSVPAFIVNQKYLISGGQPKENFVEALREIMSK